jgi:hexosaminidase
VKVSGSVGQVTIDGATIGGPLAVQNNTGSTVVSGNHISGPLSCTGNSPAPTNAGRPNSVSGPKSGQCSTL